MALEVETIDGRRTAYIREESDIQEVRAIQGIESLWIMSECRSWVREPLLLSGLRVLYVSSNTLPIIELIAVDCLANLDWLLGAVSKSDTSQSSTTTAGRRRGEMDSIANTRTVPFAYGCPDRGQKSRVAEL
jgi:hypothetical protein